MMARMDGRNVVISRVCAVIALAVVMHMLPIVPAHAGGGWLSESIAVAWGMPRGRLCRRMARASSRL